MLWQVLAPLGEESSGASAAREQGSSRAGPERGRAWSWLLASRHRPRRRLLIETGSVSTESGRSEFESWIPKESVPVPRAGTAGCERQQKRQNISFPSGSSVWLR